MRGSWLLGAALLVVTGIGMAAAEGLIVTIGIQFDASLAPDTADAVALVEGVDGDVTAAGNEIIFSISTGASGDAKVVLGGIKSSDESFVTSNDLAGGGSETHTGTGDTLTTTTSPDRASSAGAKESGESFVVETE